MLIRLSRCDVRRLLQIYGYAVDEVGVAWVVHPDQQPGVVDVVHWFLRELQQRGDGDEADVAAL